MNTVNRITHLTESLWETNHLLALDEVKIRNATWWKKIWLWVAIRFLLAFRSNESRALVMVIRNSPKDELQKSLGVLLGAGGALFDAEDFTSALYCFNLVLGLNSTDNQDIRLPALMGRLECNVAIGLSKSRDGLVDYDEYAQTKCLYFDIERDLDFASTEVREELRVRLQHSDSEIRILSLRTAVVSFRKALLKNQ